MIVRRLLFLFLALAPAAASGTTMIELSLEDLSRKADVIFIGRCVGRSVDFSEDGRLIYTDYTFQVTRVVKGGAGSEVVVRQPGGEIGDIGMRMVGAARFLPFEEALVFTGQGSGGVRGLIGLAQGKFRVITEDESGVKYAVRDVSELLLIRGGRQKTQTRVPTPVKLNELVEMIQAVIKKEDKQP